MEGNAYLFRIPNSHTRNHVINQRLWKIDSQTMFVAKWEPRLTPEKPELISAPVWVEFRNVPHQFFSEEGFEHIAGMVGHPNDLHPSTANMTNLEVAKVLTVVDLRKPLPEVVNVKFQSGQICRIGVSSPWIPPICSHCKGVGHSLKRCANAPVTCSKCISSVHNTERCPKAKENSVARNFIKRSPKSLPTNSEPEFGKTSDLVHPAGVLSSPHTQDTIVSPSNHQVVVQPEVNISSTPTVQHTIPIDHSTGQLSVVLELAETLALSKEGSVSDVSKLPVTSVHNSKVPRTGAILANQATASGAITSNGTEEPGPISQKATDHIVSGDSHQIAIDKGKEKEFTIVLSRRQLRRNRDKGPKTNL